VIPNPDRKPLYLLTSRGAGELGRKSTGFGNGGYQRRFGMKRRGMQRVLKIELYRTIIS
jgi:hypothetical protein